MKKIFCKNKKTNLLKHSYRPCDFTQNWSDSEHTQSSQTCNNGRFRMTLLRGVQTAALTLALSLFIAAPAMAQAPVPTLDRLNQEGATIPDTDPAQVYPESAYTLTEIENADPENLPQNAITLYDKNEDGTVTPKYYLVNLKDSVTNIGEGDSTKYFEWSQNSEGRLELKEVSAPTEGKTTITVKYDNADTGAYYTTYINKNKQETHTPVNSSGVTTELPGGAAINNTSQDAVSINNTLFQNNITNLQANISGSFSGNAKYNYVNAYGGALYNAGDISSLSADFIDNSLILDFSYDSSKNQRNYPLASGGAFYNEGQMGNVSGNFVNNSVVINAVSNSTNHQDLGLYSQGGAIGNGGVIDTIEGVFAGNFVTGNYNVTDDGNSSSHKTIYGQGGAISNTGEIKNINADFINNYAIGGREIHNGNDSQLEYTSHANANGGAIFNYSDATIGNITGDFIGNYASTLGGAIYNYSDATIGNITGDFIGNYVSTFGGAIYNSGEIGNITGNFIGNYASSSSSTYSSAKGGAIFNYSDATIGNITGDFIGNYATSSSYTSGGAIYNDYYTTIGDITGDFIGNYASSVDSYAFGGAIYNDYYTTIGDITGDFIGNYATGSSAYGGAIYIEKGIIGNITGDFIGNYASSTGSSAYGGAIYNYYATIGNITGDFIGNYASGSGSNSSTNGGAICNGETIGNITGDFIGNYVSGRSSAYGGAIGNGGTIGNITGDFVGNYVSGDILAIGGAIAQEAGFIKNINGNFIGNYAVSDSGYAMGGAIANLGYIGTPDEQTGVITEGEIKNSSFINNYAKSETGTAHGGAIFSTNNINIVADNGQSIFSGNKTISNGKEEQNAIGMYGLAEQDASTGEYAFVDITTGATSDKNTANLKLEAKNNGVIVFDDTIRGGAMDVNTMAVAETPETAYDLEVTGDSTGKVVLNNDVINANISLDSTNLYLGREDV